MDFEIVQRFLVHVLPWTLHRVIANVTASFAFCTDSGWATPEGDFGIICLVVVITKTSYTRRDICGQRG